MYCIHDICCKRRRHCLWSKNYVEQFCFTWQAILHHDKIVSNVEQFGKLIHICNVELLVIAPYDKFIMYAVLSWSLFWRKIHFVTIYALLCGAKINQKVLSGEAKWQTSCMFVWSYMILFSWWIGRHNLLLVSCSVGGVEKSKINPNWLVLQCWEQSW